MTLKETAHESSQEVLVWDDVGRITWNKHLHDNSRVALTASEDD